MPTTGGTGVRVGVCVTVGVMVDVGVIVDVGVMVEVGVIVGVMEDVGVTVEVDVTVDVGVMVDVGVTVDVGVIVEVLVTVGVIVIVGVVVMVEVAVVVMVAVWVGVVVGTPEAARYRLQAESLKRISNPNCALVRLSGGFERFMFTPSKSTQRSLASKPTLTGRGKLILAEVGGVRSSRVRMDVPFQRMKSNSMNHPYGSALTSRGVQSIVTEVTCSPG
jgi:hypothetical protein